MDEFEIIKRYFAGPITFKHEGVLIGPGDDCAVVRISPDSELCVSTDTLLEGVHFPNNAKGDLVANRALAANLSDLAAMGAEPYGFTLALTLPEFSDTWLSAFSGQLNSWVRQYKLPLLGGNLSKGKLSLTINIMGVTPRGEALLRSGATAGDDIYVSGCLGDAKGGLVNVLAGDSEPRFMSLNHRYSDPVPRIDLGKGLRGVASAMIDISDGFAADLGHLCQASQVGASIRLAALPLSVQLVEKFGLPEARKMAVQGGDDYELCFTCPPAQANQVIAIARQVNTKVTLIGSILEGENVDIIDDAGNVLSDTAGYKHF